MDVKPMPLPNVLDDCLYRMRPSDRETLKDALTDTVNAGLVVEAIMRYVERWEESNWVEDYSITRIGKWFKREASPVLVDELRAWASNGVSDARAALEVGLSSPDKSRRSTGELRTFPAPA